MSDELERLLDDFAQRYARGEPVDVEQALRSAGDRADELAPLLDVFLVRNVRRPPSADALSFVRSLDEPPILRARVAKRLRVDDVVDAIVRGCELDEESRPKVRRYYQQLEGGVLDPRPVADAVWDAITSLLGRSRAWLTASRGPVLAAAPMYRADRLFEPSALAAPAPAAEPEPPDTVDELFLGPVDRPT